MKMTFTARRRLGRIAVVLLALLILGIIAWLCWVVWLERYVVYDAGGASLNFEQSVPGGGQLAQPPSDETVSIFFNEGEDAVNASAELTAISGYYIDEETLKTDIAGTRDMLASVPSGSAVMLDVKNIKGSFFYHSALPDAVYASNVDVTAVDGLIKDLNNRNLYTIARLPAFRDWNYGLNHVSSGLPLPKGYLWVDKEGCYWLDPTDSGTLSWLYSIMEELKGLGFDEVVFSDFCFPATDKIVFKGDRTQAITEAAATLVSTGTKDNFTVSFVANDMSFALPEGRTRMYLENVGAKDVGAVTAQVKVPDPSVNLVFLAATNDTRFNNYSVLRPILTVQDDTNRK